MISWPTEPAGANISRMKVHCVLCAALLAAGVSVQTAPDSDALFAAIRRGTAAEVERTLKVGADANAVDADGVPALMAAALFGDARLVDVLLSHHADPNAKGPGGTTALIWAVPDIQKVRTLLDHGAAVNARTETERTALLVAASYPRTSALLRLLLEHGADLRAQDRGGATALSLAARSADIDVVRFLVDRGLDPARARGSGAARRLRALGSADDRLPDVEGRRASGRTAGGGRHLAARRTRCPVDRPRRRRQRRRRPVQTNGAHECGGV